MKYKAGLAVQPQHHFFIARLFGQIKTAAAPATNPAVLTSTRRWGRARGGGGGGGGGGGQRAGAREGATHTRGALLGGLVCNTPWHTWGAVCHKTFRTSARAKYNSCSSRTVVLSELKP